MSGYLRVSNASMTEFGKTHTKAATIRRCNGRWFIIIMSLPTLIYGILPDIGVQMVKTAFNFNLWKLLLRCTDNTNFEIKENTLRIGILFKINFNLKEELIVSTFCVTWQ